MWATILEPARHIKKEKSKMMRDKINNNVRRWVKLLPFYLFIFLPFISQAQTTYQQADSLKICQLLKQANRETSVLWLARQFLGLPYVAHTLEINDDERLVVNTRQWIVRRCSRR